MDFNEFGSDLFDLDNLKQSHMFSEYRVRHHSFPRYFVQAVNKLRKGFSLAGRRFRIRAVAQSDLSGACNVAHGPSSRVITYTIRALCNYYERQKC